MKRNECEEPPIPGTAEKDGTDEIKCVPMEPSWLLLASEVSSNLLAPASSRSREFARSRTWGRRRTRAWVRRTSRLNAN